MRKRGVGTKEHEGPALDSQTLVSLLAESRRLRLRHSDAKRLEDRPMRAHGDLAGAAQEGELVRIFDHPAAPR